jgi:hypothetical protein
MEGEMKNLKPFLALGIAVVVLGLSLAVTPAMISQSGPQYDFFWQPYPKFERDLTNQIRKENSLLVRFISQLQEISADQVSILVDRATDMFGATYLKKPTLIIDDKSYRDWDKIVPALKSVVDQSQRVNIQSVQVHLAYVPFSMAENPEEDVDMQATVKTLLALSSNGQNGVFLEGSLCHRRVCIWRECPIR